MGQGRLYGTIAAIVISFGCLWMIFGSNESSVNGSSTQLLTSFSTTPEEIPGDCDEAREEFNEGWKKIRSEEPEHESPNVLKNASMAIHDRPECFTKDEAAVFFEQADQLLATMSLTLAKQCEFGPRVWTPEKYSIETAEGVIVFQGMPDTLDRRFVKKHKVHKLTCDGETADDYKKAEQLLEGVPKGDRQLLMELLLSRFYFRYYTGRIVRDEEALQFHKTHMDAEFNRVAIVREYLRHAGHGKVAGTISAEMTNDFGVAQEELTQIFQSWLPSGDVRWNEMEKKWTEAGHDAEWVKRQLAQHYVNVGVHAKAIQIAHELGDKALLKELEDDRIKRLEAAGHYAIVVDEQGRRSKLFMMYNSW